MGTRLVILFLVMFLVLFVSVFVGNGVSGKEVGAWETRYGIGLEKEWEILFTDEVSEVGIDDNFSITTEEKEIEIDVRSEGKIVYLKVKDKLIKNTEYELTVLGDLESEEGEQLGEDIRISFITGEEMEDENLNEGFFTTEYGNKVGIDWYGKVLIKDISNEEIYGYTVSERYREFGIGVGDNEFDVIKELGSPIDYLYKGNTGYSVDGKGNYGVYVIGNKYVTFFYDKEDGNRVRAIHWVSKELEERNKGFYSLDKGVEIEDLEHIMVVLMNKERELGGLRKLDISKEVRELALGHSLDMIEEGFFGHKNKDNEDPMDRFKREKLNFTDIGENLAYGQRSVIYAHESLIASKDHKETLMKDIFDEIGVGIAVEEREGVPYYTVNFLKR